MNQVVLRHFQLLILRNSLLLTSFLRTPILQKVSETAIITITRNAALVLRASINHFVLNADQLVDILSLIFSLDLKSIMSKTWRDPTEISSVIIIIITVIEAMRLPKWKGLHAQRILHASTFRLRYFQSHRCLWYDGESNSRVLPVNLRLVNWSNRKPLMRHSFPSKDAWVILSSNKSRLFSIFSREVSRLKKQNWMLARYFLRPSVKWGLS